MSSINLFNTIEREENYELMGDNLITQTVSNNDINSSDDGSDDNGESCKSRVIEIE